MLTHPGLIIVGSRTDIEKIPVSLGPAFDDLRGDRLDVTVKIQVVRQAIAVAFVVDNGF